MFRDTRGEMFPGDDDTENHVRAELPGLFEQMDVLAENMHEIRDELWQRRYVIDKHMKHCGTCMSAMINQEALPSLWEAGLDQYDQREGFSCFQILERLN